MLLLLPVLTQPLRLGGAAFDLMPRNWSPMLDHGCPLDVFNALLRHYEVSFFFFRGFRLSGGVSSEAITVFLKRCCTLRWGVLRKRKSK